MVTTAVVYLLSFVAVVWSLWTMPIEVYDDAP
jgi:hypothetical protein